MLWLRESPSYFRFRNGTIRLEEPIHDEVTGHKLDIDTGAFEPATQDDIDAVFEPGADLDFSALTEEQFVKETEEARNHYLRGEGPIFDIYRQMDQILDQARRERRQLEPREHDLLTALRRKTFDMWEQRSSLAAPRENPPRSAIPVTMRDKQEQRTWIVPSVCTGVQQHSRRTVRLLAGDLCLRGELVPGPSSHGRIPV